MKSNKSVKTMLIGILSEKHACETSQFWFDGGQLWVYEEPMGYFEGDEVRYWWHWHGQPYVSLDAGGNIQAVAKG